MPICREDGSGLHESVMISAGGDHVIALDPDGQIWSWGWGLRGRLGSGSEDGRLDRKSTRLNSSHVAISYAVFCLKKKMVREQNADHDKHSHKAFARAGDAAEWTIAAVSPGLDAE